MKKSRLIWFGHMRGGEMLRISGKDAGDGAVGKRKRGRSGRWFMDEVRGREHVGGWLGREDSDA